MVHKLQDLAFLEKVRGVSAVHRSRGCLCQATPHTQACLCFMNVGCCSPEHLRCDRQCRLWHAVQPSFHTSSMLQCSS